MKYARKRDAQRDARQRRQPHQIMEVISHTELCLHSDGLIIPKHRCTCGKAKRTGWVLQLR